MPYNIHVHLALPKLRAGTKAQTFETIAAEVSQELGCTPTALSDALSEIDKRDNSAIGNGIAIPHLKLQGLEKRFVALATLQQPVDFDAPDGEPVDLVCLLLSPEEDGPLHLRRLSRISRLFRNQELCRKIRGTSNVEVITQLFANPEGWLVAA